MLEIILVIFLSRKIAAIAKDKGRSSALFVLMLVGFWIGGEIAGAVIGVMVMEGSGAAPYLLALGGAAAGAVLAFVIASSVSAVAQPMSYGFPVHPGSPYAPGGQSYQPTQNPYGQPPTR